MAINKKQTSGAVASTAAKQLANPKATAAQRSVAASALAQAHIHNSTGKKK